MKIPEWLEQALTAFDQETKPHNELTIMEALDRARKSQGNLSDDVKGGGKLDQQGGVRVDQGKWLMKGVLREGMASGAEACAA